MHLHIGDEVIVRCHSVNCHSVYSTADIKYVKEFTLDWGYLVKWRCPVCGKKNVEVFHEKTAETGTILSVLRPGCVST